MERKLIGLIVAVALILGAVLWGIEDLKSNSPEGVAKRFLEALIDQDYALMNQYTTGRLGTNVVDNEQSLNEEIRSRSYRGRLVSLTPARPITRRPDYARLEVIFQTLEEISDQNATMFRHTVLLDLVNTRGAWKVGNVVEIGLEVVQ